MAARAIRSYRVMDEIAALRRTVTFDAAAVVWFDPATGLPVDQWLDGMREPDAGRLSRLAASRRRVATSGAELWAVCVGPSGMWAGIVLRRERGFTGRDVEVIASLTTAFEELRRARLARDLAVEAEGGARGLLLLDDEDRVELADPAAAAWLDELRGNGELPLVVSAVADRAREIAAGHGDAAATARVRTPSGHWVLVRGSVLNGAHASTAVTLEPARAPELAELIADAHGLTARERRVTQLVARGLPTAKIAAQLYLSKWTVQDHLKAIFEKLGVSSRGELVARLYVDHSLGPAWTGRDLAQVAGEA